MSLRPCIEALRGVGDPGSGLRRVTRHAGLGLATAFSHNAIERKLKRYEQMKQQAQEVGNDEAVAYWDDLIKKAKEKHKQREGLKAKAYVKASQYSTKAAIAAANISRSFAPGGFASSVTSLVFADTGFRRSPMQEHTRAKVRRLIESAVAVRPTAPEAQQVLDDFGEAFHDLKVLHARLEKLEKRLAAVLKLG